MAKNKDKTPSFGSRLKQLRVEKGLSQTELGELTKTHYTQIGRYERGLSKPNAETLHTLADALGVTSDYLYDGELKDAAVADLKDKELLEMFAQVETLADKDKEIVKELLKAFLMKKTLQDQLGAKAS